MTLFKYFLKISIIKQVIVMALQFPTKSAQIARAEEMLYNISTTLAESDKSNSLHKMFVDSGITHPPEMRSVPSFATGGGALAGRDTIIIDDTMPEPLLKSLAAHETAHIVFGDLGQTTKHQEFRADRFSAFITGDSGAYSDHLKTHDASLQEGLQVYRNLGIMGKFAAAMKSRANSKTYGNIEERLANLQRPVSEQEKHDFQSAIQSYNSKKSAQGTISTASSDLVPPAENKFHLSTHAINDVAAVSNAIAKQNGGQFPMETVELAEVQKLPERPGAGNKR